MANASAPLPAIDLGALMPPVDWLGDEAKNARTVFYCAAYPHLLRVVACLDDDLRHEALWATAHIAYGWMPTALTSVETDNFGIPNGSIFAAIRANGPAKCLLDQMDDVAPINRSWVGTSKLLHFVNPERFPIWDTRVAGRFGLKYPKANLKLSLIHI